MPEAESDVSAESSLIWDKATVDAERDRDVDISGTGCMLRAGSMEARLFWDREQVSGW